MGVDEWTVEEKEGRAGQSRAEGRAEGWLSVIPINPNTYILKFMIKSQTCWFVRGHSHGGTT